MLNYYFSKVDAIFFYFTPLKRISRTSLYTTFVKAFSLLHFHRGKVIAYVIFCNKLVVLYSLV